MTYKMAAENRKLNISDCMADKTEILNVKSRHFVVNECIGNKANYNMLSHYKICITIVNL